MFTKELQRKLFMSWKGNTVISGNYIKIIKFTGLTQLNFTRHGDQLVCPMSKTGYFLGICLWLVKKGEMKKWDPVRVRLTNDVTFSWELAKQKRLKGKKAGIFSGVSTRLVISKALWRHKLAFQWAKKEIMTWTVKRLRYVEAREKGCNRLRTQRWWQTHEHTTDK